MRGTRGGCGVHFHPSLKIIFNHPTKPSIPSQSAFGASGLRTHALTFVDGVWCVDDKQGEVPASRSTICPSRSIYRTRQKHTHKKNVCVVGNAQLRSTSSVVVTFVQVMHSETT